MIVEIKNENKNKSSECGNNSRLNKTEEKITMVQCWATKLSEKTEPKNKALDIHSYVPPPTSTHLPHRIVKNSKVKPSGS